MSGHFFGYFLFGLEKKVPRLPDGSGEVEKKEKEENYETTTGGAKPLLLLPREGKL
jgi:hypothetical protein